MNKQIFKIIENNLVDLKKIDFIIDNDVKNDIKSFNPDGNAEVRRKLMDSREIFMPKRESKFENIIDSLIETNKVYFFIEVR